MEKANASFNAFLLDFILRRHLLFKNICRKHLEKNKNNAMAKLVASSEILKNTTDY